MTALVWGESGQRFFESGVDRGVIYPKNQSGIAWDGLVSVDQTPNGADPRPYYLDGFKYLNLASSEEFSATIRAFSTPLNFESLDGTGFPYEGLSVTQQPRKSFDFSYRTMVGNDTDGIDHGYKIHIVYDALTSPAKKNFFTISDSPNVLVSSWDISTTPPIVTDIKPTSYFVVDSTVTPPDLLLALEDILYGSTFEEPKILSAQELSDFFTSYE